MAMDDGITIRQSYLAMYSFLDELYTKYGFEELGGLIGSLALLPDGSPADPVKWNDWLAAVERAKAARVNAGFSLVGERSNSRNATSAPQSP